MPNDQSPKHRDANSVYFLLFFLSGFPALLYQIVWQRALFTLYGVNIESVTMIVTVFMLGLGLGSLAGGWLSSRRGVRLLLAFGVIEFSVGAFGVFSLWIFHRIGLLTAGASTLTTGLIAFALLLAPTVLMGSTLPLLVEHFVRRTGNVGESVGLLYSVNTLGSGTACLAAAFFVMRLFGESGSVWFAASFNFFVGLSAFVLQAKFPTTFRRQELKQSSAPKETIPFWIGMVLAATTGFIALAYEIVWYRLYSFVSGGSAPCFAMLLAFYLFGIAYGSFAVRDACRKKLGNDVRRTLSATAIVVLLGTIAAFLLGPVLAHSVAYVNYHASYTLVFIAAALLGSAFPLLAHAAIDPAQGSGKQISYLYLSNIIGSTLGSFLVGFVLLDHLPMQGTSLLLLFLGLLTASTVAVLSGPRLPKAMFAAGCVVVAVLAVSSGPLFSGLYERLLFKMTPETGMQFSEVVENRSGVVAVYPDSRLFGYPTRIVYGGGVYDGQINTDILQDSNGIIRTYAVLGMHPQPKKVLVIGLSTGAWAQIVANDPEVRDVTIIEINPGYLSLIRKYPKVQSLLTNPKVHILIDDGRRWLLAHPDNRFDLILMNTTFNWRAHASNLLSVEFLRLIRAHMNPGGIAYYNTTNSGEAFKTGATVFPYALRFQNFLAVSDNPFALDKDRWRKVLTNYRIDGNPIFDLSNQEHRTKLNNILKTAEQLDLPGGSLESRASLQRHYSDARVITDDNMGTEWSNPTLH